MSLFKRVILSLPALLIAVTIFILSHGPQPDLPKLGIEWEDKLMHAIAYFIFGLAIILFLIANFSTTSTRKLAILTFLIGASYAGSDELHQSYIPGRYCEFLDWVADVVGIIISIKFINILKNKIIKT